MNVDTLRASSSWSRDPDRVDAAAGEVAACCAIATPCGGPARRLQDDLAGGCGDVAQGAARPVAYLPLVARSPGRGGAVAATLMLASVNARVPEIGLRRAVGARPRDIRLQFLLETAATVVGGGPGARIGVGCAWYVAGRMGVSVGSRRRGPAGRAGARGAAGLLAGWLPARRPRGSSRPSRCVEAGARPPAVAARAPGPPGPHGPRARRRRRGTAASLTSALGAGAAARCARASRPRGTNLLVVRPAQVKRPAARRAMRGVVTSLARRRRGDRGAPGRAAAAPGVDGGARVKAGLASRQRAGHGAGVPGARGTAVAAGRFLDEEDDAEARRVAVLGARVAETLFPGGDAVGRDVRIRGLPFEVVGVLSRRASWPTAPTRTATSSSRCAPPCAACSTRPCCQRSSSPPPTARDARGQSAVRALLRERHRLARGGRTTSRCRTRSGAARRQTPGLLRSSPPASPASRCSSAARASSP